MNLIDFTDRVCQNPSLKKIKTTGSDGEYTVIEELRYGVPQVQGTKLNASLLQQFQNNIKEAIESHFPIGCVYISTNDTSPSLLFGGSWTPIAQGRTLFGAGQIDQNSFFYDLEHPEISAEIPNIKAYMKNYRSFMGETQSEVETQGAFSHLLTNGGSHSNLNWSGSNRYCELWFNANNYSGLYKDSATTVQPNALVVKIWERVA